MNKFYAVLIVIFFVFYFADRAKRRKASKLRNANQCIRCGAVLETMQWEVISVAGGPLGATQAPACPRCARRDVRLRTAAWVVLGLAFTATIALLFVTQ